MEEQDLIINRDTLYEQVWTEPITKLAKKYKVSDVGLAKICKKLDVPRPLQGHWAKLRHGKKVEKIPLPPLKEGTPETYKIQKDYLNRARVRDKSYKDKLIEELNLTKQIIVPKKLISPHPLIIKVQDNLKDMTPDNYGVLRSGVGYLDIRVGPKSLGRALRILNALINVLESKGFKVDVDCPNNQIVRY